MMKFFIDSIEPKYCIKTNPEFLKIIQDCKKCHRIPLPSYRSYKDPANFFCKECYFSQNMMMEDLCIVSNGDLKLNF